MDFLSSDTEEDEEPPVETVLGDDVADFIGSDAKDHVEANLLDNLLIGGAGKDLLGGLDGADTLFGDDGDDRLFGGNDDDLALGGAGNDRIFLGDGDDTTVLDGDAGSDAGDDWIRGGAGADTIVDSLGVNNIFGDIGHDEISTLDAETDGSTPDSIHGGYGNDTLIGDDGDILTGGFGDDSFVVAAASDQPGAPVVLTDFDLREDMLSVVFVDEVPEDTTLRLTFDAETDLIRAYAGEIEVATLSGLTASDIPFITTFVTTLPELMAETA
ncbi:hypothetical protein Z946_1303 [Sulfitobacter noctilucicola]|nr:hypothetical protein Z946_1303 [Sulfitobacter noctilucicola]